MRIACIYADNKSSRLYFIITPSNFQDNAHLVRDVYAYFPILMKYTDLHRAQWLKSPSWETDGVYENVAIIFKVSVILKSLKHLKYDILF